MQKQMNTRKSRNSSIALPVATALAMAIGAWGRSGPEHRTLRPLAMGNAFVAVADDKDAMHYNPAGLNLMGRLGNSNLRPQMSRYPLDKFDMHMDFLGTAIPVDEALDILKFYQDHQGSFQSMDQLKNDSNLVTDLSAFDRRPVKVAVLHGGELAMHNFGMAYWADAQMAPYADVGVLLPQAGVDYIQLDIVGQIAGATSYFEDRLSVGLGYRMAKREQMGNFQVALTDLSDDDGRKSVQAAIQDSVDEKVKDFADLGTLGGSGNPRPCRGRRRTLAANRGFALRHGRPEPVHGPQPRIPDPRAHRGPGLFAHAVREQRTLEA
jgi:hypothetical protein